MSNHPEGISRRRFLQYSGAGLGIATAGLTFGGLAFGQSFPSRNMSVVIPSGEGGGLDRTARAFTSVWSQHLGANFEFRYFSGASGQVGYERYLSQDADCYNLLFGNIGPEMIMYATQDPPYSYPEDFLYFAGLDTDDAVIWVANDSPYQTIEDLVDAAQDRTLNISTSRLPHPASLGVLALAEATGANFELIPYGGGSPARSAAITGEVDACATFMGSSLSLEDQIRFLTIFHRTNRLPGRTNEAPVVNEVFGSDIPPLTGNRTWAIQRAATEQYPDRFQTLTRTVRAAFEDPAWRKQLEQANIPWEFAELNDADSCQEIAQNFITLAQRHKAVLTGAR